jgi:hypothetical protein
MRNSSIGKFSGVVVSALFICACSSQVRLHTVAKDSDVMGMPQFLLPGSWVTLGIYGDDETKGSKEVLLADSDDFQVSSVVGVVSSGASGSLLAIEGKDNIFSTTKVNYSYLDNSKRLKSVGINFEDNTVKAVQAAGGLMVSAITLFPHALFNYNLLGNDSQPPPKDPLRLPVVLDLSDKKIWTEWSGISGTKGWAYKITMSKDQEKARVNGATKLCSLFDASGSATCDVSSLDDKNLETKWLKMFPVARCVTANVVIRDSSGKELPKSIPVTIADPEYVDLIALPEKGTITMHSICGADLAIDSSSAEATRTISAIQAVFDQAKAIKAAQDARNKKAQP